MKKNNLWLYISAVFFILAVLYFVLYLVESNENNKLKSSNDFSMDSYMEQQYVNGQIDYYTYSQYKSDISNNILRFGLAFGAIFVGLGVLFHGLTLVDARHHLSTGWDENDD